MFVHIKLLALLSFFSISSIAQNIPLPAGYSVVDSVSGDLDKDGIAELVIACNTGQAKNDYESIPRELIIYKKKKNAWEPWKRSTQALLGSRDGGMMGDPFGEIEIRNGILSISHNGGSSWKWGHTDKYRFQNDQFYLIGYTSSFGKPCEYWTNIDFNLSTGKIDITKEYEKCEDEDKGQKVYKTENESFVKKGLSITLEKRREREIVIKSPKYKHEFYLSSVD